MALPPECQLNRLADLVPPPRKHRHRYHGVFAPNHKLRRAVTALAVGRGLARVPQEQVPVPGCRKRQGNTGKQGQAPTAAQPEPVPRTTPRGLPGRNSWPGWVRSFRSRARTVAATSGRSRSLPTQGPSMRRPPAGVGSLRTGGSQAGNGHDGIACVKQNRRQCHPPAARPPTRASSCRSTMTAKSCNRRPKSCL
jgi:hypothetical protein